MLGLYASGAAVGEAINKRPRTIAVHGAAESAYLTVEAVLASMGA